MMVFSIMCVYFVFYSFFLNSNEMIVIVFVIILYIYWTFNSIKDIVGLPLEDKTQNFKYSTTVWMFLTSALIIAILIIMAFFVIKP